MTTNTFTSDPAVSLELGRRLAANANRPPRLRQRLGAAWSRMFADKAAASKPGRGCV